MNLVSSKVIASCLAFAAFAVAIVSGLASDVSTAQVLLRAVVAMFVCYPVGIVIGAACAHAISTHVLAHQKEEQHKATPDTHESPQRQSDERNVMTV